jgi:hypothetical protein
MDSTDGTVPDPHERAREKKKKQLSQTDDRDEIEKLNKQLASYDKDAAPLSKQDHSKYMSIIGTVQYIAVVTRPDKAFAAASLARFMSCPTHHLMNYAVRLLRYLSATRAHVLRFSCGEKECPNIVACSDSDFAACSMTSKSTSGIAILFRGQPVHW